MKLKLNIPTTLDNVTLRAYKKYHKLQNEIEDIKLLKAQMIHIFCNVSLKDVYNMRYNDSEEVISILNDLFIETPKLVTKFNLNGVDYGFHTNLDEMSLGEYIDLDTYIGDWDNIEKAMNVLYRPITAKYKTKYSIDEYKVDTVENILDMPMSAVTSSIFFFVEFRNRLVKDYEEIFGEGTRGGLDRVSQLASKWGWYQSVYELAGGDVTRLEDITELGMHKCFTMLAYKKERAEVEAIELKKNFKK